MKQIDRVMGGETPLDRTWAFGLFLAALILFAANLGNLPLRDWDEGIVAQVARDIWRATPGSLTWLHPTLAGVPYLNKPPLVHWCIALAYRLGGVSETTTRLPCALFAAASIPMLYTLVRELLPQRLPAIFSALVYLTLLPVVRHGRLAMLDGAVLCFLLFFLWCVLRSRRDWRYSLGIGIGLGLLCLTKGLLGALLGSIAIAFLLWDTPRLLVNPWVWLGTTLGVLPAALWYAAQWQHYGLTFADTHLFQQSFQRVWMAVEANTGPPWYYAIELLKYSWPWLLFWIPGLKSIWFDRNLGASKLVLVWTGLYLTAISLMGTKLPWYVLPVYPAFAIACGVKLAQVWQSAALTGMPDEVVPPYPRAWLGGLGVMAGGTWGAIAYFSFSSPPIPFHFFVTLLCAALTLSFAFGLMLRRDAQFLVILIWGLYLSLLLFVTSDRWIWELNEDYPVQPVAALIREKTPPNEPIYTSHPHNRPSLNFYSDRPIFVADESALQQHWQQDVHPYLLVRPEIRERLQIDRDRILGEAEGWELIGDG
jgi:4-amino-4-deoxy-L-arabinose transferase-like glycosyltransferase